ncbi:MAG: beta-lactamase family protein [Gemmatimonadaceae bacterium]|nr:beta-lactamase family protein [Gemmatimonadaceae bacterium]
MRTARVTTTAWLLALAAPGHAVVAQRLAVADTAACAPMPSITPAEAGIPQTVVDSLQRVAEAMKSDAFLIVRDGKVVHEWSWPGFRMPWNPQSVTKAITGLGVGVLLDRGAIASLDLPLVDLFPEFAAPDKRPVTLRMIMNHTSGIAAGRGERQFAGQRDVGAFVRGQPMAEPAGSIFRYSNVGAQLTSHVVQARAGMPLHTLVDSALFRPMCIRDWRWETDDAGATYGYSRVHLTARDLAKIGQLVLDGGTWRGQRLLREATVDTLTMRRGGRVSQLAPIAYVGLWQYWGGDSVRVDGALVARLAALSVSDTLLATVRRLADASAGRPMLTSRLRATLDSAFGSDSGARRWARETGDTVPLDRWRTPAQAMGHSGSWGQWLLVFPETRTVVVRFASWRHPGRSSEEDGFGWGAIVGTTYRLVGTSAAGASSSSSSSR